MKGYIFDILFSYLHPKPKPYPNQQLPKPTFQAESIVLAQFHQASIAAFQAKDETNNTFNIYLLIAGIIAAGLPLIQGLIEGEHSFDLRLSLSILSDIILLLAGILSFLFLSRFLNLAQERFESIKLMNNIQDYYDKQLENIVDFDKIYGQRDVKETAISVPAVMRNAVFIIGSLYIGGAIGISFNVWWSQKSGSPALCVKRTGLRGGWLEENTLTQ